MPDASAVVWDVGRVLVRWDLRCLFGKLIEDPQELEWFVANVVTEEWHFQHDRGRPIDDMIAERQREFPAYADTIAAYRPRFNETIPGPVAGTHEIVAELADASVPQYALTNFGSEFWDGFAPTQPVFRHMRDIVVSGKERCVKPDAAIYAIAEDRFGLPPGQLFFIDDKAENIAAATARGWQGHVFHNAPALRAELVELGLLPPG